MKLVYICSALSGDIENNIKKAQGYCREIILGGEIPIAPHIYFTQFLDDEILAERELGIDCGIKLLDICEKVYVFGEKISKGMKNEIEYAKLKGIEIVYKK